MVLRLPNSWSNWNLEVLVFEERGKPGYPEKNLSEQGRQQTTNSTHIWCRHWDVNLGNVGGRQVPSSLRQPCSPSILIHVCPFSGDLARALGATMVELECLENGKIYITKQILVNLLLLGLKIM